MFELFLGETYGAVTVQTLREILKLSREELAQKLSVTYKTVRDWEVNGTEPLPVCRKELLRLCVKHLDTIEAYRLLVKDSADAPKT